MKLLIVDAEVIFASLIKRGYKLVTPEYIFEEVKRKEEKLLKYSKLEQSKLWYLLFLSLNKISPVPKHEYERFLEQSKKISPVEDFPYSALALKYKSSRIDARIWSNDPELIRMLKGKISVVTTDELRTEIGCNEKSSIEKFL